MKFVFRIYAHLPNPISIFYHAGYTKQKTQYFGFKEIMPISLVLNRFFARIGEYVQIKKQEVRSICANAQYKRLLRLYHRVDVMTDMIRCKETGKVGLCKVTNRRKCKKHPSVRVPMGADCD